MRVPVRPPRVGGVLVLLAALGAAAADASELRPRTAAAFDRYVDAAERRMSGEVRPSGAFLWVDTLDAARQQDVRVRLRRGEVVIERLRSSERIEIPDGLVHHWVGIIFIPSVRVRDAVRLMQDYDRHAALFAPNVVRSRILERRDDRFRVFLRFYMKKVISVTLDTENDAQFVTVAPDRVYSTIRSTRISEVEEAGTPAEKELAPGQGHGFMWRLNTYWRFLERDDGTYVQCESITLSRDVPFGLGWVIRPFITEVPKDSLTFTLQRVRAALATPGRRSEVRGRGVTSAPKARRVIQGDERGADRLRQIAERGGDDRETAALRGPQVRRG